MTPANSQNQNIDAATFRENVLTKYLLPPLLVAALTAFAYFIGWHYTDGYLSRLGIQHKSVQFSTSYYLTASWLTILAGVIVFLLCFTRFYETQKHRLFFLRENLVFLIVALILVYIGIWEFKGTISYSFFVGSACMLILFVVLSLNKTSIVGIFWSSTVWGRILTVLLFFLIALHASFALGSYRATMTIEGRLRNIILIKLKTKPDFAEIVDGEDLILIMHNDNKYYLAKLQNPAPKSPRVYVVPDDQVKFAVLTRLD